jgi:hypothetical protein
MVQPLIDSLQTCLMGTQVYKDPNQTCIAPKQLRFVLKRAFSIALEACSQTGQACFPANLTC